MNISPSINQTKHVELYTLLIASFMFLLTACSEQDTETNSVSSQGVVEVTAVHDAEDKMHLFQMSRQEISSGWTTFEFNNASGFDHFFLIWKVPDESIEAAGDQALRNYWTQNIIEPFQTEYNRYVDEEVEFDQFVENLGGTISESAPWFFDPGAQTMGGPGFTAAGRISETTVYLEPGEYIAECYVKNEDEVFHSAAGMLQHFTVLDEDTGTEEPTPTSQVPISSEEGIQFDQNIEAGNHIFEILFEDQTAYAHLQGHNVQLIKLTDNGNQEVLKNLSDWMDWRQPGSLVNRAPEGAELMGGSMEMAESGIAYYHANLETGDYAWITEVPNPAEHNMLVTFTISE